MARESVLTLTAEVIRDLKLSSREFQDKYQVSHTSYVNAKLKVMENLTSQPFFWEIISGQYIDFGAELSRVDGKISNLYHDIERGHDADAETKVLYYDELGDSLRERRSIKQSFEHLAGLFKYVKQYRFVPVRKQGQIEHEEIQLIEEVK